MNGQVEGTWQWACRMMDAGLMVRPLSATGSVRYRIDVENQRRIEWCFGEKWSNANIFLSDFEATDWTLWEGPTT